MTLKNTKVNKLQNITVLKQHYWHEKSARESRTL